MRVRGQRHSGHIGWYVQYHLIKDYLLLTNQHGRHDVMCNQQLITGIDGIKLPCFGSVDQYLNDEMKILYSYMALGDCVPPPAGNQGCL